MVSKRNKLFVARKPRKCLKCGRKVVPIRYGLPENGDIGEEDVIWDFGGKVKKKYALPDYQCKYCDQTYYKLSLPRNSKELAREALMKDDDHCFCDVEYIGLYKRRMAYIPIARPGICWDGCIIIFIDDKGKVEKVGGTELYEIQEKIERRNR